MNIQHAQQIAHHISKLAELATRFYATYGHDYRLTDDSPSQAWDMYRQIMAEQAEIASLLDDGAVENAYSRYEKWWERRDVINSGIVNEMASEAVRLVERTAYMETAGFSSNAARNLQTIQESIAGMLHPATRRQSVNHDEPLSEAI